MQIFTVVLTVFKDKNSKSRLLDVSSLYLLASLLVTYWHFTSCCETRTAHVIQR